MFRKKGKADIMMMTIIMITKPPFMLRLIFLSVPSVAAVIVSVCLQQIVLFVVCHVQYFIALFDPK